MYGGGNSMVAYSRSKDGHLVIVTRVRTEIEINKVLEVVALGTLKTIIKKQVEDETTIHSVDCCKIIAQVI